MHHRQNFVLVTLIIGLALLGSCAAEKNNVVQVKKQNYQDKIDLLADEIVSNMIETKATKVAIFPFAFSDGRENDFSSYVTERITNRIFLSKKFDLIERSLLDKAIEEIKLSHTGITDESTSQEIGTVLGANVIISGKIFDKGTLLEISARLFDVGKGKVISVANEEFTVCDQVRAMMTSNKTDTPEPAQLPSSPPLEKTIPKDYPADSKQILKNKILADLELIKAVLKKNGIKSGDYPKLEEDMRVVYQLVKAGHLNRAKFRLNQLKNRLQRVMRKKNRVDLR